MIFPQSLFLVAARESSTWRDQIAHMSDAMSSSGVWAYRAEEEIAPPKTPVMSDPPSPTTASLRALSSDVDPTRTHTERNVRQRIDGSEAMDVDPIQGPAERPGEAVPPGRHEEEPASAGETSLALAPMWTGAASRESRTHDSWKGICSPDESTNGRYVKVFLAPKHAWHCIELCVPTDCNFDDIKWHIKESVGRQVGGFQLRVQNSGEHCERHRMVADWVEDGVELVVVPTRFAIPHPVCHILFTSDPRLVKEGNSESRL